MNSREYLLDLGYTDTDVEKIVNSYTLVRLKKSTLYDNIVRNYQFLIDLGLSKEKIMQITLIHPQMFAHNISYMEDKIHNLINLGYSQNKVMQMIKKFPQLVGLDIDSIKKHNQYLANLGYGERKALVITSNVPQIFGYDIATIGNKIENICELGFKKEDVLKIIKRYPNILTFSKENMVNRIDSIVLIWKDIDRVLMMLKTAPQLFGLNLSLMDKKIDDIQTLGYLNREDVLTITGVYPQLLAFSFEAIKQRFDNICELGFSQEQVVKMTLKYPALYGLDIETIREKKVFYDLIGIGQIVVDNTNELIQGVELSYARYMFYMLNLGINITMDNYKLLFLDQRRFKSKFREYCIDNKKVLAMFPYPKEDEDKKLCK